MIHVIARIEVTSGKRDEMVDAFRRLLPEVHAEAGCIAYTPTVDLDTGLDRIEPADPNVVTMVERWETIEHLEAHLQAPHMMRFRESTGHLVQSAELRICEEA